VRAARDWQHRQPDASLSAHDARASPTLPSVRSALRKSRMLPGEWLHTNTHTHTLGTRESERERSHIQKCSTFRFLCQTEL
jgi:hypothetical protein